MPPDAQAEIYLDVTMLGCSDMQRSPRCGRGIVSQPAHHPRVVTRAPFTAVCPQLQSEVAFPVEEEPRA